MKEKILILEDSLRTNIALSKAMVSIKQSVLARKYWANAHKDMVLIKELKFQLSLNQTLEYQMNLEENL